ncbi:MAG: maltotransferase domain-containing protein [Acidimicrobiia bacterium]
MLPPIVIDDVRPRTPSGFPAKAVQGEALVVSCDLVADGHDRLGGRVSWRPEGGEWSHAPLHERGNDRWAATIACGAIGLHEVRVEAWTDRYATWRHEVEAKVAAGVEVTLEVEEGARILDHLAAAVEGPARARVAEAAAGLRRTSCSLDVRLNAGLDDEVARLLVGVPDATRRSLSPDHPLWVDRPRAAVGAWYELFPRSEGGFAGAARRLEAVAAMGFDVAYLPPIHPIGRTHRKGRGNSLVAGPDDPGSPWAIGGLTASGRLGGHTDLAPELGTEADLAAFVARAGELGLEVALDYALQCSPDHPWVHEHPEWFEVRPDGSIRYAENPPKKYQDIHPIRFWPDDERDRVALWTACRDVLVHWIERGIRIFRVDNPHTKPLAFWAWLIDEVRRDHPEVVFLAEAFTRPKMMSKLAEVGFSQSYTYFTWRTGPGELRRYVEELTATELADWYRPSFWPNTPDILSGPLRDGPRSAFLLRFLLAATLVPTYGIYSGYELCENQPASPDNEEYLDSEKYEVKRRDWSDPSSIAPFVTRVNAVRRAHPGLWGLRDVRFHHSDDEQVLAYTRGHAARDLLLCVVNLDPHRARETTVRLDLGAIGLAGAGRYTAVDELTGQEYPWSGPDNYVRLDPAADQVGHLLALRR